MFGKAKREREQLERSGTRAPATVVEIASSGFSIGDGGPGRTSSSSEIVRMTTLRVQPEGDAEFEVKRRIRYGRHGGTVPKAGDRIDVLYDPQDHEKVVVAPPTAEEEQLRTAAALSKAKIGFTMGSHGSGGGPPTEQVMGQHEDAMAQAQQQQELMQHFMSGGTAADAPAAAAVDPNAQLEQLQALRDNGTLSEEQFQLAKTALLGDA